MMKIRRIVCDHCGLEDEMRAGEELPDGWRSAHIPVPIGGDSSGRTYFDLCPNSVLAVRSFILGETAATMEVVA